MELPVIFARLGIALGLGLLVGLQRERAAAKLAGIRTFPLITVAGALCGLCAVAVPETGPWVLAAGLLALAAVVVAGNLARQRAEPERPGITTEVATLVMFLCGAYLVLGQPVVAIAVGAGVAVLLHWKEPLHRFVAQIGEPDIRAIMQFALISMVVLPVLPNRTFGPYAVWNPFKIWLLVVLIVGMSLVGYVAQKMLGQRAGTVLAGVLGGLVSSTATTVSFARQTRQAPERASTALLVILLASAVVFGRVLVLIGAAAPAALGQMAGPIVALMVVMAALSAAAFLIGGREAVALPEHGNPSELKPALYFAGLFAVVLLAVAAAQDVFGRRGLYLVAALAGLTDMDAITLSASDMAGKGVVPVDTAWRLVIVGSMANLLFKAGIVAVLGHRRLLAQVAAMFALALVGGATILIAF